jgi:hypothetical protein
MFQPLIHLSLIKWSLSELECTTQEPRERCASWSLDSKPLQFKLVSSSMTTPPKVWSLTPAKFQRSQLLKSKLKSSRLKRMLIHALKAKLSYKFKKSGPLTNLPQCFLSKSKMLPDLSLTNKMRLVKEKASKMMVKLNQLSSSKM